MHKEFRELLDSATSKSESVIALNVDIRDFSAYSSRVDSLQALTYLRKAYAEMIDDYFDDASFFKSTGDGLLVVFSYVEAELKEVVEKTTLIALNLVKAFPTICSSHPMINFEVPSRVGIGLGRGVASQLASGTKILDYTGRVLNLASRLMDVARPTGVVFDESFGWQLLPESLQKLFAPDDVYLKGILPGRALRIYHTAEVVIPMSLKQPPVKPTWKKDTIVKTLAAIKKHLAKVEHELKPEPSDPASISVRVLYKSKTVAPGHSKILEFKGVRYENIGGLPVLWIDYGAMRKALVEGGALVTKDVTIEIMYTVTQPEP
jgi:class 3 adenylate cyclase